MNIEYALPCARQRSAQSCMAPPWNQASPAPRIARLLALAHRLDTMVRGGEVKGYAELARLGRVSPARLSQILLLLHLSPAIQEEILFLSALEARRIGKGSSGKSPASRIGSGSSSILNAFRPEGADCYLLYVRFQPGALVSGSENRCGRANSWAICTGPPEPGLFG